MSEIDPMVDPVTTWDEDDQVEDDDGAYDRAYDMWLDRKLGID